LGDILTTFAIIGSHYLEDGKRVKNKAYEYDTIKVFLFDIVTKTIEPSLNITKDDLIITRFGVGANSGNLFPNIFFKNKDVNTNFDKFSKAVLKANRNLLSYFSQEEINENPILVLVDTIDKNMLDSSIDHILQLQEYKKNKGEKGKATTYFSLSYQGKPISAYFKGIYEKHLNNSSEAPMRGYDIISNKQGIGGDANLAFCSTNEMPKKMKPVKLKLLPLSFDSAKKVKIGFDVMDKRL